MGSNLIKKTAALAGVGVLVVGAGTEVAQIISQNQQQPSIENLSVDQLLGLVHNKAWYSNLIEALRDGKFSNSDKKITYQLHLLNSVIEISNNSKHEDLTPEQKFALLNHLNDGTLTIENFRTSTLTRDEATSFFTKAYPLLGYSQVEIDNIVSKLSDTNIIKYNISISNRNVSQLSFTMEIGDLPLTFDKVFVTKDYILYVVADGDQNNPIRFERSVETNPSGVSILDQEFNKIFQVISKPVEGAETLVIDSKDGYVYKIPKSNEQ